MPGKYTYYGDYYSASRKEYYDRLVFPQNPSFFNQVFQSVNTALLIGHPVVFRNLSFGDDPKIISRKFGLPREIIDNHGISSEVLFYKEKINKRNAIIQLHFLQGEFFCAGYTFRDNNSAERMRIKNTLFEKHSNHNGVSFEKHNALIDGFGNTIFVFDSVFLQVLYVWGEEKVKRAVEAFIRSEYFIEATRKEKSEKTLFNKL